MRTARPHLFRHPNRPVHENRFRRRSRVVQHDDGRVSIEHLTRAEAERLYALACQSRQLFCLTYRLGEALGITDEGTYHA